MQHTDGVQPYPQHHYDETNAFFRVQQFDLDVPECVLFSSVLPELNGPFQYKWKKLPQVLIYTRQVTWPEKVRRDKFAPLPVTTCSLRETQLPASTEVSDGARAGLAAVAQLTCVQREVPG